MDLNASQSSASSTYDEIPAISNEVYTTDGQYSLSVSGIFQDVWLDPSGQVMLDGSGLSDDSHDKSSDDNILRISSVCEVEEVPEEAVTFEKGDGIFGLSYNDHNYTHEKYPVSSVANNDHLSLLAKVALAKDVDADIHGVECSIIAHTSATVQEQSKSTSSKYNTVKSNRDSESHLLITDAPLPTPTNFATNSQSIPSTTQLCMPQTARALSKPVQVHKLGSQFNSHVLLRTSPSILPNNILSTPTGQVSSPNIDCICDRVQSNGSLVQCTKCKSWQHLDCISSLPDVLNKAPYLCTNCNQYQSRKPDNLLGSSLIASAVRIQRSSHNQTPSTNTFSHIIVNSPSIQQSPRKVNICLTNGVSFCQNVSQRADLPTITSQAFSVPRSVVSLVTSIPNSSPIVPVRISKRKQDLVNLTGLSSSDSTGLECVQTPSSSPLLDDAGDPIRTTTPTTIASNNHHDVLVPATVPSSEEHQQTSTSGGSSSSLQRLLLMHHGGGIPTPVTPTTRQPLVSSSSDLLISTSINKSSKTNRRPLDLSIRLRRRLDLLRNSTSSSSSAFDLANAFDPSYDLPVNFATSLPRCRISTFAFNHKCLIAACDLEANAPVIEYRGECKLMQEYCETCDIRRHFNPYVLFYQGIPKLSLCVDARECGNDARSVRRSCTPNCVVKHSISYSEKLHTYQLSLVLFTTGPVNRQSELTIPFDFDYTSCRYIVNCPCGRKSSCRLSRIFNRVDNVNGSTTVPAPSSSSTNNGSSSAVSRLLTTTSPVPALATSSTAAAFLAGRKVSGKRGGSSAMDYIDYNDSSACGDITSSYIDSHRPVRDLDNGRLTTHRRPRQRGGGGRPRRARGLLSSSSTRIQRPLLIGSITQQRGTSKRGRPRGRSRGTISSRRVPLLHGRRPFLSSLNQSDGTRTRSTSPEHRSATVLEDDLSSSSSSSSSIARKLNWSTYSQAKPSSPPPVTNEDDDYADGEETEPECCDDPLTSPPTITTTTDQLSPSKSIVASPTSSLSTTITSPPRPVDQQQSPPGKVKSPRPVIDGVKQSSPNRKLSYDECKPISESPPPDVNKRKLSEPVSSHSVSAAPAKKPKNSREEAKKSREEIWMAEVLRRIERMEKKQKRTNGSRKLSQTSAVTDPDPVKSPDPEKPDSIAADTTADSPTRPDSNEATMLPDAVYNRSSSDNHSDSSDHKDNILLPVTSPNKTTTDEQVLASSTAYKNRKRRSQTDMLADGLSTPTADGPRERRWLESQLQRISTSDESDVVTTNRVKRKRDSETDPQPCSPLPLQQPCDDPVDDVSGRDCDLIVYRARDIDPMAKFSRNRARQPEVEEEMPSTPYGADIVQTFCNSTPVSAPPAFPLTTTPRPSKKRWLSQALMEKSESQKPTPINPKKRLISQFSETGIDDRPVHPFDSSFFSNMLPCSNNTKEEQTDHHTPSSMSGPFTPSRKVGSNYNHQQQQHQAEELGKVKVSLTEYRRRMGLPCADPAPPTRSIHNHSSNLAAAYKANSDESQHELLSEDPDVENMSLPVPPPLSPNHLLHASQFPKLCEPAKADQVSHHQSSFKVTPSKHIGHLPSDDLHINSADLDFPSSPLDERGPRTPSDPSDDDEEDGNADYVSYQKDAFYHQQEHRPRTPPSPPMVDDDQGHHPRIKSEHRRRFSGTDLSSSNHNAASTDHSSSRGLGARLASDQARPRNSLLPTPSPPRESTYQFYNRNRGHFARDASNHHHHHRNRTLSSSNPPQTNASPQTAAYTSRDRQQPESLNYYIKRDQLIRQWQAANSTSDNAKPVTALAPNPVLHPAHNNRHSSRFVDQISCVEQALGRVTDSLKHELDRTTRKLDDDDDNNPVLAAAAFVNPVDSQQHYYHHSTTRIHPHHHQDERHRTSRHHHHHQSRHRMSSPTV